MVSPQFMENAVREDVKFFMKDEVLDLSSERSPANNKETSGPNEMDGQCLRLY